METSNNKTLLVNKGHLTQEERDRLTILHSKDLSIRNIANILGKSPSTISKELKRKEAVFYRENYIAFQTRINVIKNNKKMERKT